MKMLKGPLGAATLLLVLIALPAFAEDRGLYVGAKRGTTDVDASLGTTFRQSLRGDEDTSAILAGYRFGRFWAIEAALHDLGSFRGTGSPCAAPVEACPASLVEVPIEAESEAYSLSLVPQLPIGVRTTIYGKIGFAVWESDIRDAETAGKPLIDSFSEEEILYGLGVRLKLFAGLRLFGEWEQIGSDLETKSFGLLFQF